MNNWTIGRRVTFGFAAVILIALCVSIYAFLRLDGIQVRANELGSDSFPGQAAMGQIEYLAEQEMLLAIEHTASEDPQEKLRFETEIKSARDKIATLFTHAENSVITAHERELFQAIQNKRAASDASLDEVLKLSRSAKGKEAAALVQEKTFPLFSVFIDAIDADLNFDKVNAENAIKYLNESVSSSKLVLAIGIAISVLLAGVICYFIVQAINQPLARIVEVMEQVRNANFTGRLNLQRKDEFGLLGEGFNRMSDDLTALVGQVQKSALQLTTSVTEIAATSKQQQATTTEVAATTTEVGATSKEIAATSKELLKTITEVTGVAEQTANLAGNGQAGILRMEETMRHVMDAAGSINAKLAVLNEKAGNINQVVTTITKVADQTNLLSLNAAIEAEKAGEYGRGFAVVATEIRRLADQTAIATYDIEQMVKEMQSAVSAGVMGMDKFSEEVRRGVQEVQQVSGQLAQIIQQVQALTPRFEAVNEGMQSQVTGAQQISEALTQLTEAAQQTAESLRQSNTAIGQLNATANDLRTGVSRFQLQSATAA